MKLKIHLLILVLSFSVYSLEGQYYYPADVDALLAIKKKCDPYDSLNWVTDADNDQGSWTGVTWTNSEVKRVSSLSLSKKSLVDTLDATALTELTSLNCIDNKLTGLLVSGLTKLSNLQAKSNKLTSLDLTGLTSLTTLNFVDNQIVNLNLTNITTLRNFYCSGNKLTSLDLTDVFTTSYIFRCDSNELKNLILPNKKYSSLITCSKNHIPLSLLAALPIVEGMVLPQREVFDTASYKADVALDYTSEALIKDVATTFTFYKNDVQVAQNTTGNYTTQGEGIYYCKMVNTSFYGSNNFVLSSPVTIGEVVELFNTADVDALKSIDTKCDAENQLNWNTNNPVNWDGVTWIKPAESLKRVSKIDVKSKKLTGTLNASGLSELTQLDCSGNSLSDIDVSGLSKLETLKINDNPIPLSSMAEGLDIENFDYSSTVTIYEPKEINELEKLDYSSEALVNGVATQFVFYKDGKEIETNTTGIYTPSETGEYSCSLTNSELPGLTQNTAIITILESTSIRNEKMAHDLFYPNPAHSRIIFTNPQNISNVCIYSLNGKVLLHSDNIQDGFDISNLEEGIYVLNIKQDNSVITQKLIVR